MSPTVDYAAMRREAALRDARKRVKAIRGFYLAATLYAIIIPSLWIGNLIMAVRSGRTGQ